MGEIVAYKIVILFHCLTEEGAIQHENKIKELGFIPSKEETEWGGKKLYMVYLPNAISIGNCIIQYNVKTHETNSISWKMLMTA